VKMMQAFVYSPTPSVSAMQNFSLQGFPITKKMWISEVILPAPKEDSIREQLIKVIEGLKEPGSEPGGYAIPELLPVEAEWTGNCGDGISKKAMTEKEKFEGMMKEAPSRITVLYFHGGAYYLMDPATHRPTVTKIAKYTRGRCLSVRYRLAPQNPFPVALLDGLVAYLNLLYPPEGSFHSPVPATEIVFAGMSEHSESRVSFKYTPISELSFYPALSWICKANNPKGTVREETSAWHCSKLFSSFADTI
jgi:hypothetical protein